MQPSPLLLQRVSEALVKRLVDGGLVDLSVPPGTVRDRLITLFTKNFEEEAAIEREAAAEAEKLIRQGAPGVRRDELDLRKVEQLVKQRIAKARGFAL